MQHRLDVRNTAACGVRRESAYQPRGDDRRRSARRYDDQKARQSFAVCPGNQCAPQPLAVLEPNPQRRSGDCGRCADNECERRKRQQWAGSFGRPRNLIGAMLVCMSWSHVLAVLCFLADRLALAMR